MDHNESTPSLVGANIRNVTDHDEYDKGSPALPSPLKNNSRATRAYQIQTNDEKDYTTVNELTNEGALINDEQEYADLLDDTGNVTPNTSKVAAAVIITGVQDDSLTTQAKEMMIDKAIPQPVEIDDQSHSDFVVVDIPHHPSVDVADSATPADDSGTPSIYELKNTGSGMSLEDLIDSQLASMSSLSTDMQKRIIGKKKTATSQSRSRSRLRNLAESAIPDSVIENDSLQQVPAGAREGMASPLIQSRSQSMKRSSGREKQASDRPHLARGDSYSGVQTFEARPGRRADRDDTLKSSLSSKEYLRSVSRSRSRVGKEAPISSAALVEEGALVNDDLDHDPEMMDRIDFKGEALEEEEEDEEEEGEEEDEAVKSSNMKSVNFRTVNSSDDEELDLVVKKLQDVLSLDGEKEQTPLETAEVPSTKKSIEITGVDSEATADISVAKASDTNASEDEDVSCPKGDEKLDLGATEPETSNGNCDSVVKSDEPKANESESEIPDTTVEGELATESTLDQDVSGKEIPEETYAGDNTPEYSSAAEATAETNDTDKEIMEEVPEATNDFKCPEVEATEETNSADGQVLEKINSRDLKTEEGTESTKQLVEEETSKELKRDDEESSSEIVPLDSPEDKSIDVPVKIVQDEAPVEESAKGESSDSKAGSKLNATENVIEVGDQTTDEIDALVEQTKRLSVQSPKKSSSVAEETERLIKELDSEIGGSSTANPEKGIVAELPVETELTTAVQESSKEVEESDNLASVAEEIEVESVPEPEPEPEYEQAEEDAEEEIQEPTKEEIIEMLKDEPVYIYTSLAGGGFFMPQRTNMLATILTANRIPFTYRDLGTDDEARAVWRRYGKGRVPPGVVRGKDDIIGNWEEIQEANEDYRVRELIYETI